MNKRKCVEEGRRSVEGWKCRRRNEERKCVSSCGRKKRRKEGRKEGSDEEQKDRNHIRKCRKKEGRKS